MRFGWAESEIENKTPQAVKKNFIVNAWLFDRCVEFSRRFEYILYISHEHTTGAIYIAVENDVAARPILRRMRIDAELPHCF